MYAVTKCTNAILSYQVISCMPMVNAEYTNTYQAHMKHRNDTPCCTIVIIAMACNI